MSLSEKTRVPVPPTAEYEVEVNGIPTVVAIAWVAYLNGVAAEYEPLVETELLY